MRKFWRSYRHPQSDDAPALLPRARFLRGGGIVALGAAALALMPKAEAQRYPGPGASPFQGRRMIPRTQNVTLWVVTGGNDNTTDGTSFGTAFATVQGAINAIYARYDVEGSVQIQIYSAGTNVYPGFAVPGPLPGGGTLNIYGYSSAPIIDAASSADSIQISNARVNLAGLYVRNTGSGNGLNCLNGAVVLIGNGLGVPWTTGPCGSIKMQSSNSLLGIFVSYTDTGNAVSHWHIPHDGCIVADSITVTCTGTPAYSAYFLGMAGGIVEAIGTTFSGAATGKRFYIHYNAGARFGAVGMEAALSALPGSINGTVERGATIDDYGKSPSRINKFTAKAANFTATLPYYCRIDSIEFVNNAGTAVTGGINIGTTALGADVLSAFAVVANSWTAASGATILKPRISTTLDTTLFISAGSAWNGAAVDVVINFTDMKSI